MLDGKSFSEANIIYQFKVAKEILNDKWKFIKKETADRYIYTIREDRWNSEEIELLFCFLKIVKLQLFKFNFTSLNPFVSLAIVLIYSEKYKKKNWLYF